MIKFGHFEHFDVNKYLNLHILSDVAFVGQGSTREYEELVDDLDDWRRTLVIHRRCQKKSSHNK